MLFQYCRGDTLVQKHNEEAPTKLQFVASCARIVISQFTEADWLSRKGDDLWIS